MDLAMVFMQLRGREAGSEGDGRMMISISSGLRAGCHAEFSRSPATMGCREHRQNYVT